MQNKLMQELKKYALIFNTINGKLILRICGKKYLIEPSIKNFLKEYRNYRNLTPKTYPYGQAIEQLIFWHFIENYRSNAKIFVEMF